MEKAKVIRGERLKRAAAYRALDTAFRDAHRLAQKILDGEDSTRRQSWADMSDYAWRRARRIMKAAGVMGRRGNLIVVDPDSIRQLLENEYYLQSERIEKLRPPAYLDRPATKREKQSSERKEE